MANVLQWVLLGIALVLNAGANVLLKVGAQSGAVPSAEASSLLQRMLSFLNGPTFIALTLFGLNILFYRKALEQIPLSVGYPVMLSGSLLLATVAAWFIPSLHEAMSGVRLAGIAVIIGGVWMVTRP